MPVPRGLLQELLVAKPRDNKVYTLNHLSRANRHLVSSNSSEFESSKVLATFLVFKHGFPYKQTCMPETHPGWCHRDSGVLQEGP